jgi:YVTN family beta-propeller protein
MDFRILGPLEVCNGDRTIGLGGDKQRALLAVLLLHANQVVSADRLIDDLWGERPPPTALRTLQAHVSRLRKALDSRGGGSLADNSDPSPATSHGVLVTRAHGYLLRLAPGELDVDRFRGLVEEGREALAAGEPEKAARILRAGLALWRGPPLADFTYEAFAQAAIAQLEELHLGSLEERVEADLALGRHRDLVGELAALVERHPLRERLRAQLMLALYRCGRQAESLRVYQEFRQAMSEQLGLDAGPGLRQLEAAILGRDASLEAPLASPPSGERTAGAPASRLGSLRPRRRRLAVAAAAVIAVAVAVVVVASTGGGAASLSVIAADSVGAISPARGEIAVVVPVGSSPSALASGAGAVWVSNYNAGTISRIDPATRAVVQTIQAGSTPSGIAVAAGGVWVANNFAGTVSRIDPAAERVVQTIGVGNGPSGVAVGDGALWVANGSDGTLSRIDAITGALIKTIPLGGGATDVTVGLGAVWVSDAADRRVLRVDPQTDQVTQAIPAGTGPGAIAVGYGSVWVANTLDGTVSRIDPQTNTVAATIPVGDGPGAIAVGAGGVWVANQYAGSVSRIDPAGTVVRTIRVGNSPQGVAIAGGLVWVGVQDSGTAHRGGTLTVLVNAPFGSLDPNTGGGSLAAYLTISMTNDGLTAFKRVGGTDGAQVVPDLAISLPAPTDGGRTYTFQLRPGIRYSNGALVRPEDFRYALERAFKLAAPVELAKSIVGGAFCAYYVSASGPKRCDLSRGIVADDHADTVTFHLVAPDPELLNQLATPDAVAVPAATPDHDVGSHSVPATGPYEIAGYSPREVRLIRNPYFHEWSRAARPDGYPDQIIWKIGASTATAVTAVERGSADYTLDGVPPDRLGEVRTRFASQLHVNPSDVTIQLLLNTRVAPFNDIRVRRALNYAVDRAEIAKLLGQAAQPTCQLLPSYIQGYRPYCPYTLDPSAMAWSAPDLAKARALIAGSGTRGTRITIWSTPGGYLTDFTTAGRYLVSLLGRLGYPARIKTLAANNDFFQFWHPATKAQAAFNVVTPTYPAASQFFQFTSCQDFKPQAGASNLNPTEFCDPRLDATIHSALDAEQANSPAAVNLWARADREITDQAPFVELATPKINDLVAQRVGNYEYNAAFGILLDQLWVR